MFCGFVKSIPIEIEEAAMIDGCGPLRTFFSVVLPMLKPTLVSVGILETMWLWNDYLLPPILCSTAKSTQTIPILIQYFRGSYGKVEMGPMMACIVLTIIPIIVVYVAGQKHIIKGRRGRRCEGLSPGAAKRNYAKYKKAGDYHEPQQRYTHADELSAVEVRHRHHGQMRI